MWEQGLLDVGTGKRAFLVCRLGMLAALTEKLGRMNVPAYMPVTALLGLSVSPASGPAVDFGLLETWCA